MLFMLSKINLMKVSYNSCGSRAGEICISVSFMRCTYAMCLCCFVAKTSQKLPKRTINRAKDMDSNSNNQMISTSSRQNQTKYVAQKHAIQIKTERDGRSSDEKNTTTTTKNKRQNL